ncbi:MAG TPA: twin-arginine translocation signal domain-containing protein [Pirellulaceae bacterium]|nr:twin-arginine translocation signal domain-containing protein [Pirellulaceae bacterium]
MNDEAVNRRDFHKLTAAAIGGLTAGALLGCRSEPAAGPPTAVSPVATGDKHLCRGLNECKGQGKGGENACRGQGACATVAESSCGGNNECKGLGGCGDTVGANECKGQGGCHVPLMESAWDTLRKRKETEWAEKKLEFAGAPAKAG